MKYMTVNVLTSALVLLGIAACSAPELDEENVVQRAELGEKLSGRVSGTGPAGLRVRAEPTTDSARIGWLAEGEVVSIECQIRGELVDGTEVWDYVPSAGGYVSDAYVVTGYDGFVPGAARCKGGAPARPPSSPNRAPASSSSGSSSSMADAAIAEARRHLGYVESPPNCNMFSAYWGRGGGCQEWCADFLGYVWSKAGFDVGGLTGYSGSIHDYGNKHGTTKGRYSTEVRPGDAALWGSPGGYSAHVGMVTAVNGSSITVIHGNFGVGPGGAGMVYESTISRDETAGTGYGIYAFVSPVPGG